MSRRVAAIFIVVGLLVGIAGWRFLPRAPGRLGYAIEIVDPRPLPDAAMPQGLAKLGAMRALSVGLAQGTGPRRLLLVSDMGKMLSSGDTALGGLPGHAAGEGSSLPPKAVAGVAAELSPGPATVGGIRVEIGAVLQHLGPMLDSTVILPDTPGSLAALGPLAQKASVRYLLLTQTPGARGSMLDKLCADPSLLPAPGAQVLSPVPQLPLLDVVRVSVALVLACAGVLVIGLQLRGLTREDMARRFARR